VAAGLTPGGPPLTTEQWSALVAEWFPGLADRAHRQRTWPAIQPFHTVIDGWLGKVTIATIYQRLLFCV